MCEEWYDGRYHIHNPKRDLEKTNDGDDLSPEDLRLVEYCANNPLTEKSEIAIRKLHQNVISGYHKPWYHGIKNMTQDHEGFIYWKGIRVEHYSFDEYSKADGAARKLAKTCKALEEHEITPTSRNVLGGMKE